MNKSKEKLYMIGNMIVFLIHLDGVVEFVLFLKLVNIILYQIFLIIKFVILQYLQYYSSSKNFIHLLYLTVLIIPFLSWRTLVDFLTLWLD